MAQVRLEAVNKWFGKSRDVHAVRDANLLIQDQEFLVMVGPSGCGKTTTLRLIAGLETVDSGDIYVGERRVNALAPRKRDVAVVFQNYALYPHMTVYENMAYALRRRKFDTAEINERIKNAARILGMSDLLDRHPAQLSGGQQQRVAVGRAIVRQPKVFLFDEPLSALDAKMRVQMRAELSQLHSQLTTTMIYVTHDQVEAMTMGDRIVVMRDGVFQQVGTPKEIYNWPRNLFVAGFIGSPPMNFVEGELAHADGRLLLHNPQLALSIPDEFRSRLENHVNRKIVWGIRPEDIYTREYAPRLSLENRVKMRVEVVEPLGAETYLYLSREGLRMVARVNPRVEPSYGDILDIVFDMAKMQVFDKDTGKNLLYPAEGGPTTEGSRHVSADFHEV